MLIQWGRSEFLGIVMEESQCHGPVNSLSEYFFKFFIIFFREQYRNLLTYAALVSTSVAAGRDSSIAFLSFQNLACNAELFFKLMIAQSFVSTTQGAKLCQELKSSIKITLLTLHDEFHITYWKKELLPLASIPVKKLEHFDFEIWNYIALTLPTK